MPIPTVVRRILLSLIAIAGALLLLEVVLRLFLSSPLNIQSDPQFGWVGIPHASVIQSKEGYGRDRLNNHGFYDQDFGPKGERPRVLVLGDSFAEAKQVAIDETFSSIAESLAPGFEVINAGHSGRSPIHYAVFLEKFGQEIDPDVVVIQVGNSDPTDLFSSDRMHMIRDASGEWVDYAPPGLDRFSRLGLLKLRLMRHSALIALVARRTELLMAEEKSRLARKWVREPSSLDPEETTARERKLLDDTSEAMAAILARIRQSDAEILFLYLPEIDYKADPPEVLRPQRREMWHRFAAEHGVEMLDTTERFIEHFLETRHPSEGFNNLMMGAGHLNKTGHRITGALIAEALEERNP